LVEALCVGLHEHISADSDASALPAVLAGDVFSQQVLQQLQLQQLYF
jgi:hypothetical protein